MEAARIMVREAREFGYLEEYYPEIESSFTTLFYVKKQLIVQHKIQRRLHMHANQFPLLLMDPFPIIRIFPELRKGSTKSCMGQGCGNAGVMGGTVSD